MQKTDLLNSVGRLRNNCQEVIAGYHLDERLNAFAREKFDRVLPYQLTDWAALFTKIGRDKGAEQAEMCRKFIVLECLARNWDEIFSAKYPASVQGDFMRKSEKMLARAQREAGWTDVPEDKYWKDLALARQQMFPAAAQVVEVYSGFELKPMLDKGLGQTLRFLKLLVSSGGRRGFYQSHTDSPDLEDFNEEGWHRCYLMIAEMLERNPEIKGMFGASWFYDPQLAEVSPRLMYLQRVQLEGGAQMFHLCEDHSGNALAKSKSRIKLYEDGKYRPQEYLIVWPRKEMIKWAKQQS